MDQLEPQASALTLAICGLDVLLNALCLPVSALNFLLIAQTALLHRNLKFLLLLQSISIAAFALSEMGRLAPKLLALDVFYQIPLYEPLLKCTIFFICYHDWIGFGLLCERILATIKCRVYEHDKRPHFSIFCFIFVTSASLLVFKSAVTTDSIVVNRSVFFLCEIYFFLFTSFLCIFVYLYMLKYNKRWYKKLNNNRVPDLSLKYQLSENIRTNRQLFPSGIFHFVHVFLTISLSLLVYYDISRISFSWAVLSYYTIYMLMALTNLCIQITVIISHPMLKRRLKHNCSIVWMARRWKRRIGHMQNSENNGNGNESNNGEHCQQQQQVPQNLFGNALEICKSLWSTNICLRIPPPYSKEAVISSADDQTALRENVVNALVEEGNEEKGIPRAQQQPSSPLFGNSKKILMIWIGMAFIVFCLIMLLLSAYFIACYFREPLEKQLLQAAEQGNAERVKALLLDDGLDVNIRIPDFKDGLSALHLAAQHGYVDVAKLLLENGANATVRSRSRAWLTPLHSAAFMGCNPEIARLLMDAGAKPEDKDGRGTQAIRYKMSDGCHHELYQRSWERQWAIDARRKWEKFQKLQEEIRAKSFMSHDDFLRHLNRTMEIMHS